MQQRFWACARGLEFFNYLEQQGVKDLEKQVFATPPRVRERINRPELYVNALKETRPALASTLERLKKAMPAGGTVAQEEWTPDLVKQVAGLLGQQDRAGRALEAWSEGYCVVWKAKNDPARHITITVARLGSTAAARTYFGFALDLQRQRDELSNNPSGLPLRVIDSRYRGVGFQKVDEAVLGDRKLQPAGSNASIPSRTVLARSGDCVVDITWHGIPGDLVWAQGLFTILNSDK
jgi:hypothetical protein